MFFYSAKTAVTEEETRPAVFTNMFFYVSVCALFPSQRSACISGAEISHCAVEWVSCLQDFYPFANLIQDAIVPNEYNLDTWEKSWSLLPVFSTITMPAITTNRILGLMMN